MDVDPFDPNRRGSFFFEWRCSARGPCVALHALQEDLQRRFPDDALVLQSASAIDNAHATMNEFTLESEQALEKLLDCLKARSFIPDGGSVTLHGIKDFSRRILYAQCQSEGLPRIYDELQQELRKVCQPKERGPFCPHVTVCKARQKKLPDELFEYVESTHSGKFGEAMSLEGCIYLCVKRLPSEPSPPVVFQLQ